MRPMTTRMIAILLLIPGCAAASGWPQWRGPAGDGSSPETDLPLSWGVEENVDWRLALPARSGSTPIVVGERVFLSVSYEPEENDALELWAVDRDAGRVLWKRPLGGGNKLLYKQHLSSPSPVSDGERVWVMTGTGLVKSFDFEGNELWGRDLQAEYGRFGLKWGYASSPLLWGDSLYVQVLHGMETDDPSYLLAIDKATGENRWRVERPTEAVFESPDAYTTPARLAIGDREELLVVGGDVVTGHDPENGRELWRVGGLNPKASKSQRLVASPLVGDGLFYAFGKRGPVLALRPAETPGAPGLAWSWEQGTDVPTPVTDGRHLYIVNDKGIMFCLDAATGELVYGPERLAATGVSASPVLADGRIYATTEEGETIVVRAGGAFEILARNQLEGYTLSSPAIADGQIFLRTDGFLYAIGERRH